ncbi:Rossmann-fold NAD(P)-binding domain-containing protein [Microbacterium alcoholitolerans]|uniref:hypothetical protein n=1 Tax=unclassified Microbacterium TaxID=2609290 RepID=UPI003D17C774
MKRMDAVLVIGASGILAPAAAALASRGTQVTGVARTRRMPAGVEPLYIDAASEDALSAALGDRRWSAAIVYEPAVSPLTLELITSAVDRIVLVRTTAAVGPSRGEPASASEVLQLGWTCGPGPARWHTPEEVSAAALEVLVDGQPRVLGEIRPWSRRP